MLRDVFRMESFRPMQVTKHYGCHSSWHAAVCSLERAIRPYFHQPIHSLSTNVGYLVQRSVINCAIAGKHALCVMRTGGGKSITYQLPSLVLGGVYTTAVFTVLCLAFC